MKKTVRMLKTKYLLKCALLILLSFMISAAAVQAGPQKKKGKGPKPVGAVNSSNGSVYQKGNYGVILKYITFDQDQLYNGNDKVSFVRPVKGKKPGKKLYEKNFNKYQMTLRAGLWENFDARLVIPFFDKGIKRQSFNKDFSDDNSGFGDLTIFGRYRVFSQKKKDPFNLAVGIGLEMPTGDTDAKDSNGKTPGFIQPGGGAWNPILEVGAHKVMGPHWFGSHFLYKMTTEGELGNMDFERPDVFKYNFSYGYALSRYFDLQLELNGEVKSKAERQGVKIGHSGGHMLFLTPGVHVKIRKGMHFGLCVPMAVYRDLNGIQPSEDYRVVAKFAVKF